MILQNLKLQMKFPNSVIRKIKFYKQEVMAMA